MAISENMTTIIGDWIKINWFEVQNQVNDIGEELHKYILNYIVSSIIRHPSSGNLIKNIELVKWETGTEQTGRLFGWGIGDENKLNNNAPYWAILNYGGMSGVAQQGKGVPGFFGSFNAPTIGGNGERFNYRPYSKGSDEGGANSSYIMFPKQSIKGIHYKEYGQVELDKKISLLIKTFATGGKI